MKNQRKSLGRRDALLAVAAPRRVEHDKIGLLGELGGPVRLRELLDVAGAAATGEHVVVAGQGDGWQEEQ